MAKKKYSLNDDCRWMIKWLADPKREKAKLGISGSRLVKEQYADDFCYGLPVTMIKECRKLAKRMRK